MEEAVAARSLPVDLQRNKNDTPISSTNLAPLALNNNFQAIIEQ
jgi:hypothetical protein